MTQLWTITSLDGATVLHAAFVTPSTGSHPKDNGWAWDATKQKATRIDDQPDTSLRKWNGAAWVEDIAKVRDMLLADVKSAAEGRKMAFLSAGGAKKAEYAQKAAEVSFYDSLGGNVTAILAALALLSPTQRQAKFGYALADAAAFGEPAIDKAIERFRVGMAGASKVPAIAATEAKACAAIKAATTVTAARAVAAAINWPA